MFSLNAILDGTANGSKMLITHFCEDALPNKGRILCTRYVHIHVSLRVGSDEYQNPLRCS